MQGMHGRNIMLFLKERNLPNIIYTCSYMQRCTIYNVRMIIAGTSSLYCSEVVNINCSLLLLKENKLQKYLLFVKCYHLFHPSFSFEKNYNKITNTKDHACHANVVKEYEAREETHKQANRNHKDRIKEPPSAPLQNSILDIVQNSAN